MKTLLATLPLLLLAAAPSITETTPTPLARGSVAEISGAGYVDGGTTVTIGLVAQQVVNVQPDRVRIVVAGDTPLGEQELALTTGDGTATATVVVAPPAPRVTRVTPDPIVLGELATIQGEALDGVTEVSVGGIAATVSEQTEFLIVVVVPFDASLLGARQLEVRSAAGAAVHEVSVAPPVPTIDAISPNPARRGDLVEIRGRIVPVNVGLKIGLVDATILEVEPNRVLAFVGTDVTLGPHDVVVRVGTLSSPPEGPLYVETADPRLPTLAGIYPSNVAAGGTFWLVGQNLAGVTSATRGLTLVECKKTTCQLETGAAPVGTPFTAAVVGPAGAAPFTMQVLDEALTAPTVTAVTPDPAFRGQTLTIQGTNLGAVRTVVIGGRTQSITFFSTTQVDVTVGLETPLGAETLFVASNAGSAPRSVTVLDPFPVADEGGDDVDAVDTADDGGGDDVSAESEPARKGGGCDTGGAPALALWGIVGVAVVARRRRRASTR